MAFYAGEEDEEEQGGAGPTATGPEAAAIDAGAANSAASAGGGKAGSFVGISDYINANKPQSEKLASQVAGNVEQKAKAVDDSLGGIQSSFNQAADSQGVQEDEDLFNQVKTNAKSVVSDPNKQTSFTKLRDASYSGPQTLQDIDGGKAWGGLQSALEKAKTAKSAVGTEEGRMGLIKEISNNPRQSQGALTFDNLLLQSNPNAASKLQAAGSSLGSFDQKLAGAQQSAAEKAAQVKAQNQAVGQKAREAVSSGYTGLGEQLSQRELAADQAEQARVAGIQQGIKSKQLSPEVLQELGMSADDTTFGVDLSQFINYQDRLDKNSVATQDDLAQQAALRALAGETDLGQEIINSAAVGQKGRGFDLDLASYLAAQDQQKNAFNSAADSKTSTEWDRTSQNGSDVGASLNDIIRILGPLSGQNSVYKQRYEDAVKQKAALQSKYGYDQKLGR
jgi:hypothetical protein